MYGEINLNAAVDADGGGLNRFCRPNGGIIAESSDGDGGLERQSIGSIAEIGEVESERQELTGYTRGRSEVHRVHLPFVARCGLDEDGYIVGDLIATQRCPCEGEGKRCESGDFSRQEDINGSDSSCKSTERFLRVIVGERDFGRKQWVIGRNFSCQFKRVNAVTWVLKE